RRGPARRSTAFRPRGCRGRRRRRPAAPTTRESGRRRRLPGQGAHVACLQSPDIIMSALRVWIEMPRPSEEHTFARACAQIEACLTGTARREILADAALSSTNFKSALLRLRAGMQSNTWHTIGLDAIISRYDSQARRDGFHALHDWDGIADRVNEKTIPVDVLDFLIDRRGAEACDVTALAILLDYYFLYLLSLLSLKVWDGGDADENLDRVARLLVCLQGPGGR